jgi:hypothetical protein
VRDKGVPLCGLYRGVPARRNPFVQTKESPLRVQAAAVWDSWRSHSEQRGGFLAAAARSHSEQGVTRADDSWLRTTRRIPGRGGCRPPPGVWDSNRRNPRRRFLSAPPTRRNPRRRLGFSDSWLWCRRLVRTVNETDFWLRWAPVVMCVAARFTSCW